MANESPSASTTGPSSSREEASGREAQQAGGTGQQPSQRSGEQRSSSRLSRRESRLGPWAMTPMTLIRRMLDDMDRVFDEYTPGRFAPPSERDLEPAWARSAAGSWAPKVDVFERDGKFVVRADLPGLRKEDVRVNCTDEAITIEGERQQDREVEGRGVYRAERTYGSFYREIPVPEGADTQRAAASFENGVLEITIPLDGQRTRARRIEVQQRKSADSQGERNVH